MRTAIALILLTATASAGNNELTITETSRALRTSSANAITEDSLIGGELAYSRKLDVSFMPKLELWTVGTFAWGVADGTMFQTLTTELDTLALTVGARARYRLHHRLDASARLDIGATRAAFSVRDDMDHSASDAGLGCDHRRWCRYRLLRISRTALCTRVSSGTRGRRYLIDTPDRNARFEW
jgi:hypothetical protein